MEKEIPQEVVDAILKIPLPHVKRPDHLVWHFNSTGIYDVKSGYHIAHQAILESQKEKPESSFKLKKEA